MILSRKNRVAGKPDAGWTTQEHGKKYRATGAWYWNGIGWGARPRCNLTFVTVWALFGIELISGNAKDVIALSTNPVDKDFGWLGRIPRSFWLAGNRCVGSFAHAGIL